MLEAAPSAVEPMSLRSRLSQANQPPRLRAAVKWIDAQNGVRLTDTETGLDLLLGSDVSATLLSLSLGQLKPDSGSQLSSWVHRLAELGLMDPTTPSDAANRQGVYVIAQASEFERARLRETVTRAFESTLLHQEYLMSACANAEWEFEELPLMSKAAIRRHFPHGLVSNQIDLRALLKSGDVVLASTSGTTGERLQVYSDTRIPRLPPDIQNYWQLPALPLEGPMRTAVLTSPICAGATCTIRRKRMDERLVFQHTLFLESTRNPFQISREEVERTVSEMKEFAPDLLYVNPVYLAGLAVKATEYGLPLPKVKGILAGYQFLSHCQRRVIEQHFDAPIFDMYAATELAGSQIGTSCRHGRLHVRLDQAYVELLSNGQPVSPGELGTVTVTTHNPTMPLVRYALGDLARFVLTPCGCSMGSAWPILQLEGRARDAIICQGRIVTTRDVDECLRDVSLQHYQLSETAPGHFEFDAVVASSTSPWVDQVRGALLGLLAPQSLSIRRTDEIPLDDSMKVRFTIPHVGTRTPCAEYEQRIPG